MIKYKKHIRNMKHITNKLNKNFININNTKFMTISKI